MLHHLGTKNPSDSIEARDASILRGASGRGSTDASIAPSSNPGLDILSLLADVDECWGLTECRHPANTASIEVPSADCGPVSIESGGLLDGCSGWNWFACWGAGFLAVLSGTQKPGKGVAMLGNCSICSVVRIEQNYLEPMQLTDRGARTGLGMMMDGVEKYFVLPYRLPGIGMCKEKTVVES